ncbi:MAG: RsmB/NOP family class I SAM-dependent RNA methyltransferase [Magnetococcales bacterium]|nr:RsmB/NOP family class I SAM-dependent RNA methyltransferase [Magnetococcales bacterium]
MRPEAAIQQASSLLTDIFSKQTGADRLLNGYFRTERIGQSERALLGDLIYGVLRHRRLLEAMFFDLEPDRPPTIPELVTCGWIHQQEMSLPDLAGWLALSPERDQFRPASQLPLAEQYSVPDWMWAAFCAQWGEGEAGRLMLALNSQPTVDLRINAMKIDRQGAQALLKEAGILASPTPFSPDGLRLERRYALKNLACFKEGLLEVQDEGSQLISRLLKPQPNQTVIDLCAGGGGKSLHLATLMRDKGRVIATDHDARRLAPLKARQRRAGLRSIHTMPIRHEGDAKLRKWTGKAQGVLVDAPCSGSGTLRRNPEIKWRLTPEQVANYRQRQGALLDAGARLVQKKGRLVYATCSLLAEENQEIVADFQKHNRCFSLIPVGDDSEGLPLDGPFLTLLPHLSQTDGFFAAVFQRKS